MKTLYRLSLPYGAENFLTDRYVDVPMTHDGIKFAEWWMRATKEAQLKVVKLAHAGDVVGAWVKHADEVGDGLERAEVVDEPKTDKEKQDTKSSVDVAFNANTNLGVSQAP